MASCESFAAHLTGRKAIGIDSSQKAVALARERLAYPEKTESPLLSVGRESYRTVDYDALALLEGLDLVPVQRNSGIDAILSVNFQGRPVLLRVQRNNESVSEAAGALARAGRTKHAALMVSASRRRRTHDRGPIAPRARAARHH